MPVEVLLHLKFSLLISKLIHLLIDLQLPQLLFLPGRILFALNLINLEIGLEPIELLFVLDLIELLLGLVDLLLLLRLVDTRPLLPKLI